MIPGKDYIGVGVGVAIFNDSGEVLLMKRGEKSKNEVGKWILIGGTVDFGETLREAAIRETREELAIEIEIDEQLPAHDHVLPDENQHWVTNVFKAHIVTGTPTIQEPEKCSEIGWFSLDKLPSPIAKASQKALEYFRQKKWK